MNEVEARGLTEPGIYRVPGAEREVKDLRDRFLRGKGTPNLVSMFKVLMSLVEYIRASITFTRFS